MNLGILIILSLFYMSSEIILTVVKRSKTEEVKRINDKGSLMIIWMVMPISITAGFFLAYHGVWTHKHIIIAMAGMAVCFAGFVIRWISIIQLSKGFSVNVVVKTNQVLKTNGMYKYIRHPSYLGELLIVMGISIGMNSALSFIVVTVPVLAALIYRIGVEEKLLEEEFGEEFIEYKNSTRRMIFFIY